MRKGIHVIIGILAFFAFVLLLNRIHAIILSFFIVGFFAVIAGSIMPDILEPPTSSKHRRLFHSKRTLNVTVGIFGFSVAVSLLFPLSVANKVALFGLSCFALGYFFHLLADSTTRRGLPA